MAWAATIFAMTTKSSSVPPPLEFDAPTPAPAKPDRKIEMQLRHQFTDKETLELGRKLAEESNLLNQQEDEAKAVAKQLKAKVDSTASRVSEISTKITNGYEYRPTQCVIKYHVPKAGRKSTVRLDTSEVVEDAEMSLAEMQAELPLNPVEEAMRNPGVPVQFAPDATVTVHK